MTLSFRLLLRVVQRRMESGEELDAVLRDYPRMTEEERESISKRQMAEKTEPQDKAQFQKSIVLL